MRAPRHRVGLLALTAFGLAGLFSGCESSSFPSPRVVSPIQGVAMPFRLSPDSTWVPLSDFCPHTLPDAAIWIPRWGQGDSLVIREQDGAMGVWIQGQPTSGLGGLALTIQGETATVPVLSSTLKRITYTLPAAMAPEKAVYMMGAFNGWSRNSHPLQQKADGQWRIDLTLSAGQHPYQLVVDGQELSDVENPLRIDNGFGGFNSLLSVPGAQTKTELSAIGFGGNQVHDIRLIGSPGAQVWAWWENQLYATTRMGQDGTGLIRIPARAYGAGRTNLRLWAISDADPSAEVRIPLMDGIPLSNANDLRREDWEAQVLYFMMVDRFQNGDPTNDRPVDDARIHPKANDYGGDLAGIQMALEQGYFEDLGVTALWVSPLTRNPDRAYGLWADDSTDLTSKFSGYHGYWPVSNTALDPRFGTHETLDKLVDAAHSSNMNFLLDYVANHVHEDHPLYAEHPDWVTSLYLPDGRENTQLWDEQRLTTWFDTFLPTLDLRRSDVAEAMSDSAAWWIAHSKIDGFRHDATKHIPLSFWRMLTKKVKALTLDDQRRVFQIGETYGSAALISSYLGTGLLDAQFDFNLYDRAIVAFGQDGAQIQDLVRVAQEGLDTYGAHHLMGTITGNQDRPRFASLAEGTVLWGEDHKLAGWTRQILRDGQRGHQAMRMLTAFNLSMPGVPCIYQGDEYADIGGNDPDNRKMMRFDDLDAAESDTRRHVQDWIGLRRSRLSMTFGQTQIAALESGLLRIERQYLSESTVILINPTSQAIPIPESESADVLLGAMQDRRVSAYGCVALNGG